MPAPEKAAGALRTIGELAQEIGRPQHILRYWETRFPQLRPLQRAGNRRYYRPDDVAGARRIHRLLDAVGYTIRGVQKLLAKGVGGEAAAPSSKPMAMSGGDLRAIRDSLAAALEDDGA
jgi:DNA-binding transcriptional MerR regulator